jgi:hypothetical protein
VNRILVDRARVWVSMGKSVRMRVQTCVHLRVRVRVRLTLSSTTRASGCEHFRVMRHATNWPRY